MHSYVWIVFCFAATNTDNIESKVIVYITSHTMHANTGYYNLTTAMVGNKPGSHPTGASALRLYIIHKKWS